jgi:hypothetical protein
MAGWPALFWPTPLASFSITDGKLTPWTGGDGAISLLKNKEKENPPPKKKEKKKRWAPKIKYLFLHLTS